MRKQKKIKSKLNDFTSTKDYESKLTNKEKQAVLLKEKADKQYMKNERFLKYLFIISIIVIIASLFLGLYLNYTISM